MPSPSTSLATLRPELAGSLLEFDLAMDRQGFIGQRVLPIFQVGKKSGTFGVIPIEQLLQSPSTRRSPKSGYARGDWDFTSATYACEEHGFENPIDDDEAEIYRDYFDAEIVATARAQDAVLRNAEIRISAAVFNATTFSSQTTSITNEWDDATNAVPITDVNTACQAVWDRCGIWPNAIAFNRKVFRNLRTVSQIRDTIAASGAGDRIRATDITVQQLAECFDLRYVFVAGSAKNTAAEGQTASISPIWSDEYAIVFRAPETQDISEPCLGRTMHWGGGGSIEEGTVESYRDETVRGDVIRVRHDVDEKLIYTECAQLLDNVTT